MKDMNFYHSASQVQLTEEYYKKLLKYKDSYYMLWQELSKFFDFRNDGTVYSVDAEALADFLVPYMEEYVRVCNRKP